MSFARKLKTVLPAVVLENNQNLQRLKVFEPMRLLLCNNSFAKNTSIPKVYGISLLRDSKTKKVRNQHGHGHINKKNNLRTHNKDPYKT